MNRALRVATAAFAACVLAAPTYAWAAPDAQTVTEFTAGTVETELSNTAHYSALAAQATNNTSCRAERPIFISQPEVDGRVTVKGEDTAVTAVTCVDLALTSIANISGELYIQWRQSSGAWTTVEATRTPVSGRMVRGVGTAPGVVDYIYPANDPSQGKPHRACVVAFAPNPLPPLCATFASTEISAA